MRFDKLLTTASCAIPSLCRLLLPQQSQFECQSSQQRRDKQFDCVSLCESQLIVIIITTHASVCISSISLPANRPQKDLQPNNKDLLFPSPLLLCYSLQFRLCTEFTCFSDLFFRFAHKGPLTVDFLATPQRRWKQTRVTDCNIKQGRSAPPGSRSAHESTNTFWLKCFYIHLTCIKMDLIQALVQEGDWLVYLFRLYYKTNTSPLYLYLRLLQRLA